MDDDLDPYTARLFQIESGGNPRAVTGSNMGLGQFGPSEQRQYGITNPFDPQQQVQAVARERANHTQVYQNQFGTAPSNGQLYLMHQQGVAGGPALMGADPSTPAWRAIRPYYGSDAVAQRAITGNIPRGSPLYGRDVNGITAGDFSNYWIGKFEGTSPSTYASASPPVLPGAASPPTSLAEPAPQPAAASGSGSQNPLSGLSKELLSQDSPAPPPQLQPLLPPAASRLSNVLARIYGQQQALPSPVAQRLIDVIQSASGA